MDANVYGTSSVKKTRQTLEDSPQIIRGYADVFTVYMSQTTQHVDLYVDNTWRLYSVKIAIRFIRLVTGEFNLDSTGLSERSGATFWDGRAAVETYIWFSAASVVRVPTRHVRK